MSRAVFLSAGGDPFISSLVLKLWKERWYDEIDKFYVCYNNHAEVPIDVAQAFIKEVVRDPKVVLIYHPTGIGNGMPITEMAQISKEDHVMLLEDDGFIFRSGIVDECFKRIESGFCDAVGSPRGSCGKEVWDAMEARYGLDYSGYGDVGPNYWPNFFFCKREDLLKTDMNFASKKFGKDEFFKELGTTMREDNYGDTFVWAGIQMRYNGVRFSHISQHHASPYEIEEYEKKEGKWASGEDLRWIHGGSLSAGLNGYLSGSLPDVSADISKQEIESRVAFWQIALEVTDGYGDFRIEYAKGIDDLVKNADLSLDRIHKKYNIYKNLLQI